MNGAATKTPPRRQLYIMLKKLLEFAGFPGLIKQAEDIMLTVEKQPPAQALASLMGWLPAAVERCNSPIQQLELLNTISPGATQILAGVQRELMASASNEVRVNLLLQHAGPLASWIRDQYGIHLNHALPMLQKSGPVTLWAHAVANFLDWTANAFVLAFFIPAQPAGLEWHRIYSIYEPTQHMLERSGPVKLLGRAESHRQLVQRSLARLLLLARSLGSELDGQQTLLAARIVDILHPFITLGDRHSLATPYGTNIHASNPPTLLDIDKPPQEQHKLFFGMEPALLELIAIENRILSQGELPDSLMLSEGQTSAETLLVLKHLRNRWSGRPVVRKSNRSLVQSAVDILVSTATIHRHLLGEASQALGHKTGPRLCAVIEDRSATGYGLLVEGPAPWASVGALLAVFAPENPRWSIGTIRRVASRPQQRTMIGLELLATEPLALRLQETAQAAQWQLVEGYESLDSHAAIYLPASALNSGQASLLTEDRILTAGETYRARHGGTELWIKVQAVLELGAEHVQYSCVRVDGPDAR